MSGTASTKAQGAIFDCIVGLAPARLTDTRHPVGIPMRDQVMVAVGTRIAPRPPRRSRRALLTHRAPPSGQTACDKRLDSLVARRTAFLRIDADARRRVRTAAA